VKGAYIERQARAVELLVLRAATRVHLFAVDFPPPLAILPRHAAAVSTELRPAPGDPDRPVQYGDRTIKMPGPASTPCQARQAGPAAAVLADTPAVTVIFPLYHAAGKVDAMVDALAAQVDPAHADQRAWLEAVFIDNASADDTAERVRAAFARHGNPGNWRLVVNPSNLGLAGSLNRAFSLARAPLAVTCHADCRFGRADYVARMVAHFASHPRAAAITGHPTVEPGQPVPLAEQFNLITNLMDILPPDSDADVLEPTGFAEGRCDGFRVAALAEVGFYDTRVRLAGEDQLLAARLRARGWSIHKAPALPYIMSLSAQQDSLWKLMRHQRMFGRTHPFLVLANRGTVAGIAGEAAGGNRQSRMVLRLVQAAGAAAYVNVPLCLAIGAPALCWLLPLLGVFGAKLWLFRRHFAAVAPGPSRGLAVWLLQIPADLAYTAGLLQGLWILLRRDPNTEIS